MKYYFMRDEKGYLKGYTETKMEGSDEIIFPNYVGIENPSQELLNEFIRYKLVDEKLTKISDEEFKKEYPNYDTPVKTLEEQQDEMFLDLEYRMSLIELGGGEKL